MASKSLRLTNVLMLKGKPIFAAFWRDKKNIDKLVTSEEVTEIYMGFVQHQATQMPFSVRHCTSGKFGDRRL